MLEGLEAGVRLDQIEAARRRIRNVALATPLVPASVGEHETTHLKLECLQRTGSFKIRGAWNRMSRTDRVARDRGFVTISAGNHGQAVAWCARRLESSCLVIHPEDAPTAKVDAMRALGAVTEPWPYDKVIEAARNEAFSHGDATYVHPFADADVIAGQGTIGLEILDDLPDVRTLVVPMGGGGLAVGVASAVKAKKPGVKVYGVQSEASAPWARAFETGKSERVVPGQTIADGIKTSVAFESMLPLVRNALDGVFAVSEARIHAAVRHLAAHVHVVAEGAGAAAFAAAEEHADRLRGPVACIVSGGNIDRGLLSDVLAGTD